MNLQRIKVKFWLIFSPLTLIILTSILEAILKCIFMIHGLVIEIILITQLVSIVWLCTFVIIISNDDHKQFMKKLDEIKES